MLLVAINLWYVLPKQLILGEKGKLSLNHANHLDHCSLAGLELKRPILEPSLEENIVSK